MNENKTVTIRIPKEAHRRLKVNSAKLGFGFMTDYINELSKVDLTKYGKCIAK